MLLLTDFSFMRAIVNLFSLLLLISSISGLSAQLSEPATIQLLNPSFEDIPRNSQVPLGWENCGFAGETPPDIHPDPMNQFQVGMQPYHGSTYLGMVVRDNDTWESVGQELTEPFVGGQCYDFRIKLARSRVYLSQSRVSNRPANYVTPTKLRVYASYDHCERLELIGETDVVSNYNWKEYAIKLTPSKEYTHVIFEVFYKTPTLIPYNGNLILDNASPFVPIDCDVEAGTTIFSEPLVMTDPRPEPVPMPVKKGDDTTTDPIPDPTPTIDSISLGASKGVLKVDAVFQIPEITFAANKAELLPASEASLQEIIDFLTINENVIIEIGGHASRRATKDFANKVSLQRAKSVVDFLRGRGIATKRLFPKGYGNSRPVCLEQSEDCKRRNQRVEVRIVKIEQQ